MGFIAKSWMAWCEMQGGEEPTAPSKSQTQEERTQSRGCQHQSSLSCSSQVFKSSLSILKTKILLTAQYSKDTTY